MAIEYINDKKCRLVVYDGFDMKGKPRRYKKTVTYTSKRNAEKQFREFENEVRSGNIRVGNISVSELIDRFLKQCEVKNLSNETIDGYKRNRKRILNTLGDPKAKNVKRMDIEDWVSELVDQDYSPKTIRNTVALLKQSYALGIKNELVNHNPCIDVELPKMCVKNERVVLSEKTIFSFLRAVNSEKDISIKVILKLALFLGLRRSEILGLRRVNLDLTKGEVFICETRHTSSKGAYVDGTKTKGSTQRLAMPDDLVQDIKELCKQNDELMSLLGTESDYLILSSKGTEVAPMTMSRWVIDWMNENGFHGLSLHGLRHSLATYLHKRGYTLSEISSAMRHTQKSTTLNIYTHLFTDANTLSHDIANEWSKI